MASFLQRIILITLILTIAIPISFGHREKSENESGWEDYSESDNDDSEPDIDDGRDDSEIGRYLRDLCSETKKSKQCWKIIKPEIARFTDTNSRNVASVIIDLATAKSDEIKDKLNHDSGDHELKKKYNSCSKNYKDANHDLKIVKGNLHSDDFRKIHARINDVVQELESCKHQFQEKSSDPAHIRNRNKEFGYFVEIVKAATNRFLRGRKNTIQLTN